MRHPALRSASPDGNAVQRGPGLLVREAVWSGNAVDRSIPIAAGG